MLLTVIGCAILAVVVWKILVGQPKGRSPSAPDRGLSWGGDPRHCQPLRRQLVNRVGRSTADRLLAATKRSHPGKSEHWYLEKVLYDLRRGR